MVRSRGDALDGELGLDVAQEESGEAADQAGCDKVSLRLALVGIAALAAVGCTTSNTRWGDPDKFPATKADMGNYRHDSYQCVRESRQEIGFGELASSVQREAQRLYDLCMEGRGYQRKQR